MNIREAFFGTSNPAEIEADLSAAQLEMDLAREALGDAALAVREGAQGADKRKAQADARLAAAVKRVADLEAERDRSKARATERAADAAAELEADRLAKLVPLVAKNRELAAGVDDLLDQFSRAVHATLEVQGQIRTLDVHDRVASTIQNANLYLQPRLLHALKGITGAKGYPLLGNADAPWASRMPAPEDVAPPAPEGAAAPAPKG